MGWLDLFRKKPLHHSRLEQFVRNVVSSFQNIKEDINNQKKWISYLHSKQLDITDSHFSHKGTTKKDVDNIKAWISHLHELSKTQQKDLKELQTSITKALEEYNKQIISLSKRLEKAESGHIKPSHTPSKQVPNSHFSYVQSGLTNPEQKLLNILLNFSDPVSYDKISQSSGKSISTIRVNMNNLKKKNLIEENLLPSGIKLFSIKNKEKIKKIYNISTI